MNKTLLVVTLFVAGCASAPKTTPLSSVHEPSTSVSSLPATQQTRWTLVVEQLKGTNIYIDEYVTSYDVFWDVLKTSVLVEDQSKDIPFTEHKVVARCSRRVYTELRTIEYLNPEMTFTRTLEGDGGVVPFGKVGYYDAICAMALGYADTGGK